MRIQAGPSRRIPPPPPLAALREIEGKKEKRGKINCTIARMGYTLKCWYCAVHQPVVCTRRHPTFHPKQATDFPTVISILSDSWFPSKFCQIFVPFLKSRHQITWIDLEFSSVRGRGWPVGHIPTQTPPPPPPLLLSAQRKGGMPLLPIFVPTFQNSWIRAWVCYVFS